MSTPSATLTIENGLFKYGAIQLPTSSLKTCWASIRTKQVSVRLLSAKGSEYRTMLIFHLETIEKVEEIIKTFLTKTTIFVHMPPSTSREFKWYSPLLTAEEMKVRQCPPGTDDWPNTDHEKLERIFDIHAETIQRVTWPNYERTTTPSDLREIQNWIES